MGAYAKPLYNGDLKECLSIDLVQGKPVIDQVCMCMWSKAAMVYDLLPFRMERYEH